jgi:hypothetical protein
MKKIYLLLMLTFLSINGYCQMGEWTWMNGDSAVYGSPVYGTLGVFAPNNTPGALRESGQWTDKQGNFWLFGGEFGGFWNDLWKFDPSINQWAWMNNSVQYNVDTNGNYGIQNVASPNNRPGGRGYGIMTWVDTSGNLWLFGGEGWDTYGNLGIMNDLWKYDISINEWTWIKGSDSVFQIGVYGTMGVENPLNTPGARYYNNATWVDSSNNLWLFGGIGYGNNNNTHAYLSDLWKYNIVDNAWTWMKGPQIVDQHGIYGALNTPDSGNIPSGRFTYSARKADNGDFWLFGGIDSFGYKNDLWSYSLNNNDWTWRGGTTSVNDSIGSYTTLCNPDFNNVPVARFCNSWAINCDNFIIYGGALGLQSGPRELNDMWNYNLNTCEWTWINGSLTPNQQPYHGTLLASNPLNTPGGRDGFMTWVDNNGYLWLFGGGGNGSRNDLWKFVPDTTCPHLCNQTSGCNQTTGINEIQNNKPEISLYPNPTSGTFTLSYNQLGIRNYELGIYDVLGQEVYTQAITNPNQTTITVSQLSNGVYFYQLTNQKETYRGKFVKE